MKYDPAHVATFFDDYGDQEWTRFDDGRTPRPSLAVHFEQLRRYVNPGDRVLDAGAGPGRFTIELARIGGPILPVLGVLIAIVEAAAVLVLRAHYTMDVFAAIVTALWAVSVADALAPSVDRALAALVGVAY